MTTILAASDILALHSHAGAAGWQLCEVPTTDAVAVLRPTTCGVYRHRRHGYAAAVKLQSGGFGLRPLTAEQQAAALSVEKS